MNQSRRGLAEAIPSPLSVSTGGLLVALLLLSACTAEPEGDDRPAWRSPPDAADQMLAPIVAAAIRQSRDEALEDGAHRLPAAVRDRLAPHFSSELLDNARWTLVSHRWAVDTVIAGTMPHYDAMALDNVIVFFNEPTSRQLKVWIHELLHVRQARSLGVDEFARQYVADWQTIEAETRGEAARLVSRISTPVSADLAGNRKYRIASLTVHCSEQDDASNHPNCGSADLRTAKRGWANQGASHP